MPLENSLIQIMSKKIENNETQTKTNAYCKFPLFSQYFNLLSIKNEHNITLHMFHFKITASWKNSHFYMYTNILIAIRKVYMCVSGHIFPLYYSLLAFLLLKGNYSAHKYFIFMQSAEISSYVHCKSNFYVWMLYKNESEINFVI